MAPPELAADAPVLDVVHPVVVGVDPLPGDEADLAAVDDLDRALRDRLAVGARLAHGDEPLVREHRLDDLPGAGAARHHQAVLAGLDEQTQHVEVGDDALAGLEAVESAIGLGRLVVDLRVEVEHANRRQAVALSDRIVVGVVRRRDLDHPGAELAVDVGVGDDRDLAVAQGQPDGLADELGVALVVGVHHHRGVAEHGLGPRRGDDQRIEPGGGLQAAVRIDQRIADVPEEAVLLLALDLEVGDRALEHRVPAHEPLAAVDQALVVKAHEGLGDDGRELLVHREVLAAPVDAGAEAPHLARDRRAAGGLPLPDAVDEGGAPEVVPRAAGLLQLALDDDLRRDARVVGARQPQGVVALHPVPAGERVHDRLVERVPHVQRAGDVGRWQLDAERGPRRVERRGADGGRLDDRRPARLDGGGLEGLGEFGHGKGRARRDAGRSTADREARGSFHCRWPMPTPGLPGRAGRSHPRARARPLKPPLMVGGLA